MASKKGPPNSQGVSKVTHSLEDPNAVQAFRTKKVGGAELGFRCQASSGLGFLRSMAGPSVATNRFPEGPFLPFHRFRSGTHLGEL